VLHYAPGEQFAPHYDFIDDSTPAGRREVAATGQRAVTFLAYLNDGYEGGETAFPLLGGRYKRNKGDALFYSNVTPDGSPDRRTMHAGTPLKRGEKWLMSQWIRSRPTGAS
jgi:prolyl 4-hydroxylase